MEGLTEWKNGDVKERRGLPVERRRAESKNNRTVYGEAL
jgi:hypothetical protein